MAAMLDRGDNHHVLYLGSCMLTHSSTGLGVLQKPLRELYFAYSHPTAPPAQERYLVLSPRGMTMSYKESPSARPTELFYAMPNILFWDATQFVTVKHSDKKRIMGAFEPLDNNHSRCKDNLFSLVDKKFSFLQTMTHPPLFTCVLRRTSGVKALDVHTFVCASDTVALGLVRALNAAQHNYTSDELVETGVFGYHPFEAPAGAANHAESSSEHWHAPPSSSSSSSGFGRPLSRVPSTRPPMPTPPQAADRHALTPLAPAQRSSSAHNVHQLTQEDFRFAQQQQQQQQQQDYGLPKRDSYTDDDVYQYIGHIEDSLPRDRAKQSATKNFYREREDSPPPPEPPRSRAPGSKPVGSQSMFAGAIADRVAREAKNKGLGHQESAGGAGGHADLSARGVAASAAAGGHWNVNGSGGRGGDGGGERVTAATRPFQASPRPREEQYGGSGGPRGAGSGGKLGQGYSFLSSGAGYLDADRDGESSGSGGPSDNSGYPGSPRARSHSPSYTSSLTRSPAAQKRVLPHYRDYDRQNEAPSHDSSSQDWRQRASSREDLRDRPIEPLPPRPAERSLPPWQQAESRRFTPPGRSNEPAPQRPVAKVPPHKVTGVRVLPAGPISLKPVAQHPTDANSLPDHRQRSSYYDDDVMPSTKAFQQQAFAAVPPRRSKSQYFDENNTDSGSNYESNWQFNRPKVAGDNANRMGGGNNPEPDPVMSEKLLLTQKKNAEIASLMENLQFGYDGQTMSPGMPAGNNFEKSLGYFP